MGNYSRRYLEGGAKQPVPRRSWGRRAMWPAIAVVLGVAVAGVALVARANLGGSDSPAVERGAMVDSFTLNDALTGTPVSLSDYLGKQEVVVVTLMGGF